MKTLTALFLISTASSTYAETLKGVARTPAGEVLYTETHQIERDDEGLSRFIRVEYRKPDGKLFATMTSDFSKNKTIPETEFEDQRFGSKTILKLDKAHVVFEEIKDDKVISSKKLPLHSKMVASQGFDNFIRMNAKEMEKNNVTFKFGVLERKDFYTLTGFKKSSANSEDEIHFGIRASNWLFRLFANELSVAYEPKTMKLESFRGPSNVLDDMGRSQDVVINYE